jgi:trans-aconitate 2-methyltransferase
MSSAGGRGAPSAEWDASAYHRVSDPQVRWGREVLRAIDEESPLRGGETAIDAGCGTGRLTAELLDRLPAGRVFAVDRSPSMLAEARRTLLPRYAGRVSFVEADLLELPFERTADLVFSTATFHWVSDHPALFARIHRALAPGGRLVAQCGGGPNVARVLGRVEEITADPRFAARLAGFRREHYFADGPATERRLRAARFVDVRAWVHPAPVELPDAATYREFARTVILRQHLAAIADDALGDELLDRITELAAGDDPPFSLDYWRLELRGRRRLPRTSLREPF